MAAHLRDPPRQEYYRQRAVLIHDFVERVPAEPDASVRAEQTEPEA